MNFVDLLLSILHYVIICINILGPSIPKLRKVSLIVQGLTIFSWLGLGFFYGIGYCALTDIHWEIKSKLGESNLPGSFIKFQVDSIFNIESDPTMIDLTTAVIFLSSVIFNLFCLKKESR